MATSPESKPETFPFAEYIEPRQLTRIFYWFVTLLFTGLMAGIFISWSTHSMLSVTVLAITLVPVFLSLFFIARQKFDIAAAFLAVILISAVTLVSTWGLGIHHLGVVAYPTILIMASLVLKKRTMLLITVYNILCVAWLVFGELAGFFRPDSLVHSVPGDFFTISIILMLTSLMTRLLIELLFQSNQQLQRELSERKLVEAQLHKQAVRAEALASLSHLLTQTNQDRQLMLNTIVQTCATLIGDGASIFLYAPGQEYFELAAAYNPEAKALEIFHREFAARPLRVDEGTYARVLQENQPILIPVVPMDKLIKNSPDRREYYSQLPFYSMMLAPLSVPGRILGIIGMARHQPDHTYTSEDMAFLQDIANRSALSMLNAQLYEEVALELAERKRAEEKYRNIFENAIDGIFQSMPEGRFINVNPAMARMYGYASPEEMLQSVTDISSQMYVDTNRRDELRRRLEVGERLTGVETLDYRKDGSTIWASMNIQAIHDDQGRILYYEGTVEDITERKKVDEALRESEERYRTLFNRMLDGIYRSTHDGRFVEVNPAMVKMFGYENREELLAIDIKKDLYFSAEERERLFLDTHDEKTAVFRMKRKDGSEVWVEDRGNYVHDPQGNVIYHEGIVRDVTPRLIAEQERQRAEQELRQHQQRLQAFFNQSLDGFFFLIFDTPQAWHENVDKDETLAYIFNTQHFTDVNNAMLEQYGLTRAEFLTRTSRDFFAHDLEQGLQLRRQLFDKGHLHMETFEFKANGTPVWFDGDYACLYDEQKRIMGFFGIQRDITERKRAQVEIQKLNEQLQQRVQELEAKNNELTQFTYTVSHDLKSPLVTINGFMGYLEQDMATGDVERINRDLQRIQEAVNKMHNLLTQLLELSRIGRMMNTPENIPFDGLVQDALALVHGPLEARHVTVHTQPNLPTIHGDRQRLTEVLQNLIENAAKYMGAAQTPLIEIGQQGVDPDNKPIFFIKDNGLGIEPEHHERIFGLFNKLDPKTEGTGIGLTLVKKIIEVHGGRIWLESDGVPGKGSTFYFTLPVSD